VTGLLFSIYRARIKLIKICRRTYRIDRAWMYDLVRIDPMYLENIHQFVEEAKRHANK
jgi:hypothetical protein